MDMDNNYDAFDNYAMKYNLEEDMNKYKYLHSYRVMKECENIAKSMDLSDEDIYLAKVIGLFHDLGRFNEWDTYKSFVRNNEYDHGDYAVKVLEEGLIKEIEVNQDDYDIVKTAIKNHNKYEIDSSVTDEVELLYSKIVRDADKLDILYAYSNPKILEINCDDSEISEEVRKSFFDHKLCERKNKYSKNESIIDLIGLIYDLNFDYSFEKIIKEKYIDSIYKNISNKKLFKEYFDEIKKYLKERK